MKLTITDDEGTLLDTTDITPEEWRFELEHHPHGLLSTLDVGTLDDEDDTDEDTL